MTTTSRCRRPRTALAALVGAALLLAGCADSTEDTGAAEVQETPTSETAADGATDLPADVNSDDVMFAQMMIPHHQQAVELTELAAANSENPALLDLSGRIAAVQEPEIAEMTSMLEQWGAPAADDADHAEHLNMAGMVDDATMTQLESLSGAEFDTLWTQSMIAHHQGAVEMAQAQLSAGANPQARDLAAEIVAAQEAEIAELTALLAAPAVA